jgi:hypothetical protein
VRPIVLGTRGSRGFFDETGIADASSVFEREIDSSARINLGAAFSTEVGLRFSHIDIIPLEWLLHRETVRLAKRYC